MLLVRKYWGQGYLVKTDARSRLARSSISLVYISARTARFFLLGEAEEIHVCDGCGNSGYSVGAVQVNVWVGQMLDAEVVVGGALEW